MRVTLIEQTSMLYCYKSSTHRLYAVERLPCRDQQAVRDEQAGDQCQHANNGRVGEVDRAVRVPHPVETRPQLDLDNEGTAARVPPRLHVLQCSHFGQGTARERLDTKSLKGYTKAEEVGFLQLYIK